MDHAARDVMNEFKDIVLAFGESDEYRYMPLTYVYGSALILTGQFSVPALNLVIQSAACENIDHSHITVHIFICVQLEKLSS